MAVIDPLTRYTSPHGVGWCCPGARYQVPWPPLASLGIPLATRPAPCSTPSVLHGASDTDPHVLEGSAHPQLIVGHHAG